MRISTSRYMRYKMKIDTESPVCVHCNVDLETLSHIFLFCPKVSPLIEYIEQCIKDQVDVNYIDENKICYITCNHENPVVNYLWVATKFYISSKFQNAKSMSQIGLKNYIVSILHGESQIQQLSIRKALGLD